MYANDEPALNDIAGMKSTQRAGSKRDHIAERVSEMLSDPEQVADLLGTYCSGYSDAAIFAVLDAAGRDDVQGCANAASHLRDIFASWALRRVESELRRAA